MKQKIINLFGVKINLLEMSEAVDNIKNFIVEENKQQVSVTNVYSLVIMQKDKEFREINNSSGIVVADGMPLVWVSGLFDEKLPERIAGPDLTTQICRMAEKENFDIFLLGATDKTLKSIFENFKEKYPKLRIVGMYSPPFKPVFTEEENRAIIEEINSTHPDIIFVGLTAPKQEKWIYHNIEMLDVKVAIGIGAAFDFFAGTVKRAPVWMQNLGLEWFYRFLQEPTRLWKRYCVGNITFIFLVLRELIKQKIIKI